MRFQELISAGEGKTCAEYVVFYRIYNLPQRNFLLIALVAVSRA